MRNLVVLLVISTFCMSQVAAKKLEDQVWNEVSSDNFSIYSTLGVDEATELLHNLELLRAAIPVLTNIQTTESSVPTRIIALKKAAELRKFGFNNNIAGVFIGGLRNNLIITRSSKFLESNHVILHEYVHFLTNSGGPQDYPKWFSEGFAEYFSSARLNGNSFEVGRFPADRLRHFRNCDWISLKLIISNNPVGRDFHCMFYPESWATVHYIQSLPGHAKMLGDYLHRVEAGEDHVDAFVEAFDTNITRFNRLVREHVKKGQFSYVGIAADELIQDFKVSTRRVPREEISLVLGQAALRSGKFKNARRWFDIAATSESTLAEANAGIGDVYKFDGDYATAAPYFTSAVELAPDNPLVQLDMGEYWLNLAGEVEEESVRDEHLKTARKYFGKAWQLNDMQPETYAMYGRSYLLQGRYEKSIDTLEAAYRLLPSSESVRLDLAEAYLGLNRLEEALGHARAVKAWSHSGSKLEEKADALVERIENSAATASD